MEEQLICQLVHVIGQRLHEVGDAIKAVEILDAHQPTGDEVLNRLESRSVFVEAGVQPSRFLLAFRALQPLEKLLRLEE